MVHAAYIALALSDFAFDSSRWVNPTMRCSRDDERSTRHCKPALLPIRSMRRLRPTHRCPDSPIAAIELHHVALPTRREHKWTGLTEPIGGYVLVKMTDDGRQSPAGARRRRSRTGAASSAATSARARAPPSRSSTRYLAPAVQGLHAGRDRRTARAHGPRHQGLSLRQGGGRVRRLRSRRPAMRPAGASRCWAARCAGASPSPIRSA